MKFITYTNFGCTEMCKNLIASARLSGIKEDDLIVACIDRFALDEMYKFHKNSYLFIDQEITSYQSYSQAVESKFKNVVRIKLDIIKENYDKHKSICYVDCDIVFKQDPRPLFNMEKVLLQEEFPNGEACTGFMVFNNDNSSKQFLEIVLHNTKDYHTKTGTDQELINYLIKSNIIPKENYEYLSIHKFLNGMCFIDGRPLDSAIIIHNNCIVGIDKKINRFKHYNLWYM